jgi:hypothetical protein
MGIETEVEVYPAIDAQLERGDITLQMVQWNHVTRQWERTTNPVAPADGQFGYWTRDSATGIVTLATATDDLNIEETIITKRLLAGGVK